MPYISQQDREYLLWQVEKGGPTPEEDQALQDVFKHMGDLVRAGIATREEVNAEFRFLLGALLEKPDNLTAKAILKPYGYAGDFEIIDNFYTYWMSDNPQHTNWDRFGQSQVSPQAVRNRKRFFIRKIGLYSRVKRSGEIFRILDVGSGPARDILEYFIGEQDWALRSTIRFDCVDMDPFAIDYAKKLCRGYEKQVTFHRKNAFRYRSDELYDFAWSAGLFDYLDDKQFVFLLKRMQEMLKPGGVLIVGNFADNPSKDYIEAGDWYLNYRTEDDLMRLAEMSGVSMENVRVECEETGANLFLVIEHNG